MEYEFINEEDESILLSGTTYAYEQCAMLRLKRGAVVLDMAATCDVTKTSDMFFFF